MFNKNRIEKGLYWDRAWSLVDGCTPVSAGCDHCWSRQMAERFRPEKSFSEVVFGKDKLEIPGKVKEPTVWSVWNDLFHEAIPFEKIWQALDVVRNHPEHLFLVLTKRPERMKEFFCEWADYDFSEFEDYPFPNLWLGVTAENQEMADKRIPLLLKIPAVVRFVSVEPMLGPVDLTNIKGKAGSYYQVFEPITGCGNGDRGATDWVICGAETGANKREMNIEWARKLKADCVKNNVPFFFKKDSKGSRVLNNVIWNQRPKV